MVSKSTTKYIIQRGTGILILPLCLWFLTNVLLIARRIATFDGLWAKPYNLMCFLLFIYIGIYHGFIGLKTVIDDYLTKGPLKYLVVLTLYWLILFSGAAATISMITLHLRSAL